MLRLCAASAVAAGAACRGRRRGRWCEGDGARGQRRIVAASRSPTSQSPASVESAMRAAHMRPELCRRHAAVEHRSRAALARPALGASRRRRHARPDRARGRHTDTRSAAPGSRRVGLLAPRTSESLRPSALRARPLARSWALSNSSCRIWLCAVHWFAVAILTLDQASQSTADPMNYPAVDLWCASACVYTL